MKKQIVSVFLVLLICSLGAGLIVAMANPKRVEAIDPNLLEQVRAHQQIIDAMSQYFSKLQEKKILPKPDEIDAFKKG